MDKLIRNLVEQIIQENIEIVSIAIQNRNKFEGWLKFELANKLLKEKLQNVTVEPRYERKKDRYDLSFFDDNFNFYPIELKTPNTNWHLEGVKRCARPITKNIQSIISDTKKLNSGNGIIAFVLFPIPKNDTKWHRYFDIIQKECDLPISIENNSTRMNIKFDNEGNECDVIVCTYFAKVYNSLF